MSDVPPEPAATPPVEPIAPAGVAPPPPPVAARRRAGWGVALGLAIVAGLLAWWVGESIYARYEIDWAKAPPDARSQINYLESVKRYGRPLQARRAAVALGALGGALGLGLGLAGGLARRSTRSAALAGLVGLLLGGAVGATLPAVAAPAYFRQHDRITEADGVAEEDRNLGLLRIALVYHAAAWGAIGLVAGLAFGLGRGGDPAPTPRRVSAPARAALGAVGGLIGGVIGAGVYEVLGAVAFIDASTTLPVATQPIPRLVGTLAVAILAAAIAVAATDPKPRRPRDRPSAKVA